MISAKLNVSPDPVGRLEFVKVQVKKRILKKAIRAGTKVIVSDVKSKVPILSGALKRSISTKVDSLKDGSVTYGIIGPRSGFTARIRNRIVKPSRYAHFLELGYHARPFLLPAWQSGKGTYLATVQNVVLEELNAAINSK